MMTKQQRLELVEKLNEARKNAVRPMSQPVIWNRESRDKRRKECMYKKAEGSINSIIDFYEEGFERAQKEIDDLENRIREKSAEIRVYKEELEAAYDKKEDKDDSLKTINEEYAEITGRTILRDDEGNLIMFDPTNGDVWDIVDGGSAMMKRMKSRYKND